MYATNTIVADGVSSTYNFTFVDGYISRDYVIVSLKEPGVDEFIQVPPGDFTFASDFSITLYKVPIAGTLVKIERKTDVSVIVDFLGSSRITERNLDLSAKQALNRAAEVEDLLVEVNTLTTETSNTAKEALHKAEYAVDTSDTANTAATAAVTKANEVADVANKAKEIAEKAATDVGNAVAGSVISFNGRRGAVTPQIGDYTKTMLGLGNVDNTADVDKPLSNITATEIASIRTELTALRNAVQMNMIFENVPTVFSGAKITVTKPHVREMIWNNSEYIRAPWHLPGKLQYFYHEVSDLPGHINISKEVTLQTSMYPDLAKFLGIIGTSFTIIGLGGYFIRCLDGGNGVDIGRVEKTIQLPCNMLHNHNGLTTGSGPHSHTVYVGANGVHQHTATTSWNGDHAHNVFNMPSGVINTTNPSSILDKTGRSGTSQHIGRTDTTGGHNHALATDWQGNHDHTGSASSGGDHTHSVSIDYNGESESRPINYSFPIFISF